MRLLLFKGMIPVKPVKLILFLTLIFAPASFYTVRVIAGVDLNAPTASESPLAIDEIWRRASSKYDSRRTEILRQVDSTIQQGPFRADWESLKNYDVPEWYLDAKFGIFHSLGPLFSSCLWQ